MPEITLVSGEIPPRLSHRFVELLAACGGNVEEAEAIICGAIARRKIENSRQMQQADWEIISPEEHEQALKVAALLASGEAILSICLDYVPEGGTMQYLDMRCDNDPDLLVLGGVAISGKGDVAAVGPDFATLYTLVDPTS